MAKLAESPARHVIRSLKGGWAIRSAGAERAVKTYSTKNEAIRSAQDIVRREKGVLYIHDEDGTIAEKRSFVSNHQKLGA